MDVRGLTLATQVVATPQASGNGFTAGTSYMLVALGIDTAPANPVIYGLVVDDNGRLQAISVAQGFTFSSPAPAPPAA